MGQLSLRGLHKRYGDAAAEVISGIDLEIQDGEFLVLVGPSGCGKSTLLRMIAGLETISGGDLYIDGRRANDVHPAARGAAMVFQSYALYPHMTVAENMGFALRMAGVPRSERDQRVREAAEVLRITELLQRFPKELSGGQRQRVAIGRAIVRRPSVFLFDEPLSNLDASLRTNMRIELSRLHKTLRTTMVYVTHDQVEAMTLGDRIAVFHEGRLEQVGPPMDLYRNPATLFVAGFLGSPRLNVVPRPEASSSAAHRELWSRALADTEPGGVLQHVGLRPEHMAVVNAGAGAPAKVVMAEHLGDTSILHLRVEGVSELLRARVADEIRSPEAGESVGLVPDARHTLRFDAAGKALSAS